MTIQKMFIGGIAFLFVILNCGVGISNSGMSLKEVEVFIGAELPSAATDIHYKSEEGIDRIVYLRFQLPAEHVEQFLASINFNETLQASDQPFPATAGSDLEWWLKSRPKSFAGGSATSGNQVQEVLVDRSDPAVQTIYLRVYER